MQKKIENRRILARAAVRELEQKEIAVVSGASCTGDYTECDADIPHAH